MQAEMSCNILYCNLSDQVQNHIISSLPVTIKLFHYQLNKPPFLLP